MRVLRWLVLIAVTAAAVSLTPALAADCSQSLQDLVNSAPTGAVIDVPACTYHETVYVGHGVTLDGGNQAVITGDNTRDRWFWIAASDVTIKNFRMLDANTSMEEGAIATAAGIRNVVIDHNDLGPTKNGDPIAIGGTTNSRITNNQIHDGGQLGIETYQNTNLLISGNHVYGNSTAGVDPYFGAGGIKAVQETNSQIIGNEVDHNVGPGIWCDIGCTGVTIANNNVHDHAWNPLFYEISSFGDIYGNTISASNTGAGNWGCITVSSSGDTQVHDNTCIDTLPLRAQLENRPDGPSDAGQRVVLQNNKLLRPVPNQATSWWQYDPNGPLAPGRNGNVDLNNLIVASLTPAPTLTRTPTPKPTATATPKLACDMKVRINGKESDWKPCF
jgi:Right handed beta helix region